MIIIDEDENKYGGIMWNWNAMFLCPPMNDRNEYGKFSVMVKALL